MIAQYTQAAIVSELKRLAVPASVDSIPSSAMQEDHVSMGWSAARKLRRSIDGLMRVVAIELLTAARGIELRAPLRPGPASSAVIAALRETTAPPGPDRFLAPEIDAAVAFVAGGELVRVAETATGPLTPKESSHDRPRPNPRAAGQRAQLRVLAAGGRAADADEQPRPRGRRAPRRPRCLRRDRARGSLVGGLRRDRAHAHDAGGRRDAAGAVRQAGRGVPHQRVGAAGAAGQL